LERYIFGLAGEKDEFFEIAEDFVEMSEYLKWHPGSAATTASMDIASISAGKISSAVVAS
jgi:hypothetical protein